MTNPSFKRQPSGAGRFVLWIVLLIAGVLMTLATVAAVRANPLYSDEHANGISKYIFLEECKREIRSQLSETSGARVEYAPAAQRVRQVQVAPKTVAPSGGWAWPTTIRISVPGQGSQDVNIACVYDKSTKKTTVQALGGDGP